MLFPLNDIHRPSVPHPTEKTSPPRQKLLSPTAAVPSSMHPTETSSTSLVHHTLPFPQKTTTLSSRAPPQGLRRSSSFSRKKENKKSVLTTPKTSSSPSVTMKTIRRGSENSRWWWYERESGKLPKTNTRQHNQCANGICRAATLTIVPFCRINLTCIGYKGYLAQRFERDIAIDLHEVDGSILVRNRHFLK